MFLKYPIICSHIYCYSNLWLTPPWIRVGTPFENGVADVTGCSQIGVVPFYAMDPKFLLLLDISSLYEDPGPAIAVAVM
jgi:hypothetical protein